MAIINGAVEEWQCVNAQLNSKPTQVIINRGQCKWLCVSEKVRELVYVCVCELCWRKGGLGERVESEKRELLRDGKKRERGDWEKKQEEKEKEGENKKEEGPQLTRKEGNLVCTSLSVVYNN